MKKRLAKQIAKLWNEQFAGRTEETATIAKVEGDGKEVVIYHAKENDGMCFFQIENVTDITRIFNVSAYVECHSGKCVAHLF